MARRLNWAAGLSAKFAHGQSTFGPNKWYGGYARYAQNWAGIGNSGSPFGPRQFLNESEQKPRTYYTTAPRLPNFQPLPHSRPEVAPHPTHAPYHQGLDGGSEWSGDSRPQGHTFSVEGLFDDDDLHNGADDYPSNKYRLPDSSYRAREDPDLYRHRREPSPTPYNSRHGFPEVRDRYAAAMPRERGRTRHRGRIDRSRRGVQRSPSPEGYTSFDSFSYPGYSSTESQIYPDKTFVYKVKNESGKPVSFPRFVPCTQLNTVFLSIWYSHSLIRCYPGMCSFTYLPRKTPQCS